MLERGRMDQFQFLRLTISRVLFYELRLRVTLTEYTGDFVFFKYIQFDIIE